jgi:hypothetical protein
MEVSRAGSMKGPERFSARSTAHTAIAHIGVTTTLARTLLGLPWQPG